MPLPGIFTVFPQRGFVSPADSAVSVWAAGHGPISMVLDVMTQENPEYTNTPTQSVVEDGATITDHVTQTPTKLFIEGIVTDTPIGYIASGKSLFSGTKPSAKAFAYLEKLAESRKTFDFVGGFRVYKSMVITNFSPKRNAETGDSLKFSCTMQRLVIVSTESLYKPAKAKSKTPLGNVPTKPLDPSKGMIVRDTFQYVSPSMGSVGGVSDLSSNTAKVF